MSNTSVCSARGALAKRFGGRAVGPKKGSTIQGPAYSQDKVQALVAIAQAVPVMAHVEDDDAAERLVDVRDGRPVGRQVGALL